jgi:hypothetical protein
MSIAAMPIASLRRKLRQVGEGVPPPSRHVLGDGRLADLDAELQQLAVDARRTPERVGAAHLSDQITNLAID